MVGYNQYHCPNCGQFAAVVHMGGESPKVKLWCDPCGEGWYEDDKGKASRSSQLRQVDPDNEN